MLNYNNAVVIIERAKFLIRKGHIVATRKTTEEEDQAIEYLCKNWGFKVMRVTK